MNGEPAVINGLRKLRNSPWPVIFLVVPFNGIPLLSYNSSFLISLPIKLSLGSRK